MKISNVIFHIKPIPSHPWWECKNTLSLVLALPRNNGVDVVSSDKVSFFLLLVTEKWHCQNCHFCDYIVTVFTSYPKWLLLSGCVWRGVVITIDSLKSTKKIYPGTEFNLRKIVLTFKSPWKLHEGHDGQGDAHLNISSTFVKHLECLFTPKNQENSEKGHLFVSQTFDLNFLPFQGHKNYFSVGHFWREISRSFQIRSQK